MHTTPRHLLHDRYFTVLALHGLGRSLSVELFQSVSSKREVKDVDQSAGCVRRRLTVVRRQVVPAPLEEQPGGQRRTEAVGAIAVIDDERIRFGTSRMACAGRIEDMG